MGKEKEPKKPKELKPREKTPKPTGGWCSQHHCPPSACVWYHK